MKDRVFYLKHYDNLDAVEQSKAYETNYIYSRSKGLNSESDQLKFAIDNDLWLQENEIKIEKLKDDLERHTLTQKKLIVKSQKAQNQKQIDSVVYELSNMLSDRSAILGETCETFATRKSQEAMIRSSFYKDENLKELFYTKEEFDDLENSEISTLNLLMSRGLEDFSDKNLKIISLTPMFLNSFFLCPDNAYNFFGKPVSRLTNNQMSLYSYGITVKDYASKGNTLPDNVLENPEKALSWFSFDPNVAKNNSEKLGTSVVGATIDEMKQSDPTAIDIKTIAEKEFKDKKVLNMQDMLKLHGY